MVSFLISLLVATALGFLAGMGVGGGSILLLWLTQIVKMDPTQARIINLLFYLPAALVATWFRKKQNRIAVKSAVISTLTGCCAAATLSILSPSLDTELLKKLLGGLLIITGLREIFYRPRKAR